MTKNKLVIISDTIRRDLHFPMNNFKDFEIYHFYRQASYGDMKPKDFKSPLSIQFTSPVELYKKIKGIKPDILQAPEPSANQASFIAALVCLVYYFNYHPKVIVPFFENLPFKSKYNFIKLFLVKIMTKRLCQIASLLIVLNDGAANNLKEFNIPKNKIVKLLWGSWGINTTEFKPLSQKNNNQILFLGRVTKAKGIEPLLEAFASIKKINKDAELVIAGPAGDAIDLVKKSQAKYIGSIKNTDVAKLLAEATVVAMPSKSTPQWVEQVGMVGLQALSCGTPVVTFKTGAIPEFFKEGQGTQLLDEDDVVGLKNALEKILTNNKYREKQELKARDYILSNFEVKKSMTEIENKLESL